MYLVSDASKLLNQKQFIIIVMTISTIFLFIKKKNTDLYWIDRRIKTNYK